MPEGGEIVRAAEPRAATLPEMEMVKCEKLDDQMVEKAYAFENIYCNWCRGRKLKCCMP